MVSLVPTGSTATLRAGGRMQVMLTRKQDELFSYAARLALRGQNALKNGTGPTALEALLQNWGEIEGIAKSIGPAPARRVAARILDSLSSRRLVVQKAKDNDALRTFGQECVLLFKIGRGDDPAKLPMEFGDYY